MGFPFVGRAARVSFAAFFGQQVFQTASVFGNFKRRNYLFTQEVLLLTI
ncbi:hypothetical protein HMPREF9120_01573 [Neisseria sp. oral taxon 020 str. F0370]|nr:hypothetical protein HMPREF9120_01573 [Neisseria sp. oral taxon 020 str. F0370]